VIILRLTLVSAAIYVAFGVAIEVAIVAMVKIRGSFGIYMGRPTWFVLFGMF
jgi:hypothetical protein